jgi:hypothetical protein
MHIESSGGVDSWLINQQITDKQALTLQGVRVCSATLVKGTDTTYVSSYYVLILCVY